MNENKQFDLLSEDEDENENNKNSNENSNPIQNPDINKNPEPENELDTMAKELGVSSEPNQATNFSTSLAPRGQEYIPQDPNTMTKTNAIKSLTMEDKNLNPKPTTENNQVDKLDAKSPKSIPENKLNGPLTPKKNKNLNSHINNDKGPSANAVNPVINSTDNNDANIPKYNGIKNQERFVMAMARENPVQRKIDDNNNIEVNPNQNSNQNQGLRKIEGEEKKENKLNRFKKEDDKDTPISLVNNNLESSTIWKKIGIGTGIAAAAGATGGIITIGSIVLS